MGDRKSMSAKFNAMLIKVQQRILWILAIAFALIGQANLASGGPAFEPVVTVTDRSDMVVVGEHLQILEDPAGDISFETIANHTLDDRFVMSSSRVPNFSVTNSVFWAKTEIRNSSTLRNLWYLEFADPMFQFVDIFMVLQSGEIVRFEGGSMRPWAAQKINIRGHVYPVVLAPGESMQVYFRLKSIYTMIMPARLWAPEAFHEIKQTESILHGVYFGIATAMIDLPGDFRTIHNLR